ncbi:Neuronal acetylcholine receptor subunit alpha-10 [Toxocara canis]|uniref:Neuronal acetylcholine receptor subunit alpha-10 n=1 Tax=Toxocara canis TaxID=6265 RepID=A0A0B2V918_TOXCA|nr:Neuronal acetylcholine receptor subunit alpha-10 [Toxocara canis]
MIAELIIILLTLINISASTVSESFKNEQGDMKSLYAYLFSNYQKELRPVINDSTTTTVTLKFLLKQVLKVDERDQIVNVYCWLELYWVDELLKWDPHKYAGIQRIHVPSSKIWKPDILVYNNANMNVGENELETNAIIEYNGRVMLFRSMITDITCNLNLRDFPFDQQVCFLTFASWSMDGSKVRLQPTNGTNNLELYIRNTEWTLMDFAYKTYSKVSVFLVIPSAFITVVTIVGFFTPHSTTGENTEKVSLGVTALLSMAIISKYYIGLIFLIFMAAFTTTLTLAYQMKGNAGMSVDPRIKRLLFEKIACNPYFSWAFSVQLPNYSKHNGSLKQSIFVFPNDAAVHNMNGYESGSLKKPKIINKNHETGERKAHLVRMDELTGAVKNYMIDYENATYPELMLEKLRKCIENLEQNFLQVEAKNAASRFVLENAKRTKTRHLYRAS